MMHGRWRVVHGWALAVLLMMGGVPLKAQNPDGWYMSWGYNRSSYLKSDLHVWGEGPNGPFDLHFDQAAASDMPERFQAKVYLNPTLFTIPQFDVRFARQIKEHTWLSIGWDHMKYKLIDQWMEATGVAAAGDLALTPTDLANVADLAADAPVSLDHAELWWGSGFNYEHSDGLNFVRVGLEQTARLVQTDRFPHSAIDAFATLSAGLAVCSTDFTWAGERTKNAQHVSGYGASALLGARFHAGEHLFLQLTAQSGGIRLPWVRVQGPDTEAGAVQSIGFSERAFALGYRFG